MLLGHRRLAIIDLSPRAAQPMTSADGKLVITFNGEIYNFRHLRRELESRGHRFQTVSDTEVILAGYAEYGDDVVRKLRGMFAFALFDVPQNRLLLARDPFGIKPLYFSLSRGVLRFASQVKAILATGAISREPDAAGHAGFLLWGSVPEPFTLYRDVRQIEAGTYVVANETGMAAPVRYFEPRAAYEEDAKAVPPDVAHDALLDSVRHHLESDVPVGVFLSSGIDSNVLALLARKLTTGSLRTVTLAFPEFENTRFDESKLAERAARQLGTTHETITVTRAEFEHELPALLDGMDQPSVDGINSYFVSLAARRAGLKVVLSGLGGDELFGGYPSFARLPWMEKVLGSLPTGRILERAAVGIARLAPATRREKLAALLGQRSIAGAYFVLRGVHMPSELTRDAKELVRDGLKEYDPVEDAARHLPRQGTAFGRVACMEQCMYMRNQLLRDTDWASMAHSVEVRVPLVDATLHNQLAPAAAATYDRRHPKRLLVSAAGSGLLPEIAGRRKSGFRVPMQRWLSSITPVSDMHWPKGWSRHVLGAFS